jgi:hypothetical protein
VSTEPTEREYHVHVVDDWEGTSKWFVMTAESVLGVALYCSRRYPATSRVKDVTEL